MRKTPKLESQMICDMAGNSVFLVRYTSTSGEVIQKTVSAEDYAGLIGASLKETKMNYWRIQPEFIPEGFIDGCIAGNSNYQVVFKVKGAVRTFCHTSGTYSIPYPDLVFFLEMKRGRINSKCVFALKKGNNETLYQYPFGNVSTSGNICTGNINLAEVKEYGPQMFAELFFLGKTNNDYFHEGSHISTKWSQEELLRRLDGKKEFPERLLKESGGAKTLSDIKKKIAKTAA